MEIMQYVLFIPEIHLSIPIGKDNSIWCFTKNETIIMTDVKTSVTEEQKIGGARKL